MPNSGLATKARMRLIENVSLWIMRLIYSLVSLAIASLFTYVIGWMLIKRFFDMTVFDSWHFAVRYGVFSVTGFIAFGLFVLLSYQVVEWLRKRNS